MPHYDYRCEKCGVFEVEQSIKEKPLNECPKCRGKVKRLISSAGVVFKGSGFYVTDSRKNKADQKSQTSEKPKTEKKAEKPDAKK